MGRLLGKIAIITGGANGIGKAICERFVDEGALVIIADVNRKMGEKAAQKLKEKASFTELDVREKDQWKSLMDGVISKHGKLDVLVNNAGILSTSSQQSVEDVNLEEWRSVQSVNVEGVFLGCQAAIKVMKPAGGSIVNLSSVAGLIASPGIVAYGASKGAVRQLTKSIAVDCARKGYRIRCNSVHPGLIETDMGQNSMHMGGGNPEENYNNRVALTPMGEVGSPIDIANGILFLASDEARHMTGAELVIDGGLTAV
ncbi:MAG: glucose 1-dehydrogenase [Alphaproteobacteria bacterium]|nr:glucose 1-dehydrogenase [Alphaproteobacteria bacterium]